MRILHIVGTMNLGGQETFIMNVYRNIDRSKYQFDFVVSEKGRGYYDSEIESLGGHIYYVPPIKKNVIKRCMELSHIIKNNGYKIVHRHSAFSIAFIDLLVSKLCGVKVRIIHSHADYDPHVSHILFRRLVYRFSTHRFSCSDKAGDWMFGKNKKYTVIFNGIDTDKFRFNQLKRLIKRNDLNIAQGYNLIGHVGRLTQEKNHVFLLKVFAKILEYQNNTILAIVGDGELKDDLIKYCEDLNIKENVIFCGQQSHVEDYLSAFDYFFFPSLHEGLGISLIEAEVNGLACFVSDKINEEAIINQNVRKLPLDVDVWVDEYIKSNLKRFLMEESIVKKYDIDNTIKRLQVTYDQALL